jgi:hypothetical protein
MTQRLIIQDANNPSDVRVQAAEHQRPYSGTLRESRRGRNQGLRVR